MSDDFISCILLIVVLFFIFFGGNSLFSNYIKENKCKKQHNVYECELVAVPKEQINEK